MPENDPSTAHRWRRQEHLEGLSTQCQEVANYARDAATKIVELWGSIENLDNFYKGASDCAEALRRVVESGTVSWNGIAEAREILERYDDLLPPRPPRAEGDEEAPDAS